MTIKIEKEEKELSVLSSLWESIGEIDTFLNKSKLDLLDDKVYHKRLRDECEHIIQQGQVHNILLACKIKNIIQEFKIPFFIRGSAGGSLLLYLLDFTSIDPVKHNILFERFMNQYRDTLGDIDFDLPRSLRDKVMDRVYHSLRREGILLGRLCTKVYYKENSALREAIRRMCLYHHTIPRAVIKDKVSLEKYLREKCNVQPQKVFEKKDQIVGELNYISTHVGGVTVREKDEDYQYISSSPVPLIFSDKNDIDRQKRFKIDLLSNTGLDILQAVYPGQPLDEKTFPYDKRIFQMIGEGDTIGVVFGESPLMIQTLRGYHSRFGIKDIDDIAKCLSIIRPMGRGEGKDSDLIFDDDWIVELGKMLGISLSEADSKRRQLARESRKFSKGEIGELLSKIKRIVSPGRLRQLMQISSYGFCKAHATNYAQLIYCQAYAKFHKPTEFFCAVLNSLGGRIYASWVYFLEALKRGIKISATKKDDKYIVKGSCIFPKGGVQIRLKPLSIHEELKQFGGFTSLKNIKDLGEMVACSRGYKDCVFMTVLQGLELKNRVMMMGVEC